MVTALRAHFTQTKVIPHLNRPLVSSGSFLYVKHKGIIWNTTQPFPNILVISGAGILRLSDDGASTRIAASDNAVAHGFSKAFLSLFGGDTSELSQNFEVQEAFQGKGWSLSLTARPSLARFISKITLYGNDLIERLEIFEPSGDQTTIVFLQSKANGPQRSEVVLTETEEQQLLASGVR